MAPNKRMQDVVGVGLKKTNTFTLPATPRYPPRLRPGRKAYFIRFPTVHPLHRKNRRTFWLKNQHETPAFSRSPNSFSIARSRRSEEYSSVSAYEYELGVKSPLTGRVGKGGFREVGLDGIVHDRYPPAQPSKTTAHVVYPPRLRAVCSWCVPVGLRHCLHFAVCQSLPGCEQPALACAPVAVASHDQQLRRNSPFSSSGDLMTQSRLLMLV